MTEVVSGMLVFSPEDRLPLSECLDILNSDEDPDRDIYKLVNERLPYKEQVYKCGSNLENNQIVIPVTQINYKDSPTIAAYSVFFDWMTFESIKLDLKFETVFHARLLFDLFVYEYNKLYKKVGNKIVKEYFPFNVDTIFTIGCACFYISSELFETSSILIDRLVGNENLKVDNLISAQSTVLKIVKFNLMYPTIPEFLYYYLSEMSTAAKLLAIDMALVYNAINENSIHSEEVAKITGRAASLYVDKKLPDCLLAGFSSGMELSERQLFYALIRSVKDHKRIEKEYYYKDAYDRITPVLEAWSSQNEPKAATKTVNTKKSVDKPYLRFQLLFKGKGAKTVNTRDDVLLIVSKILIAGATDYAKRPGRGPGTFFGHYFRMITSMSTPILSSSTTISIGDLTTKTVRVDIIFNNLSAEAKEAIKDYMKAEILDQNYSGYILTLHE
jgi:hypothetical protein